MRACCQQRPTALFTHRLRFGYDYYPIGFDSTLFLDWKFTDDRTRPQPVNGNAFPIGTFTRTIDVHKNQKKSLVRSVRSTSTGENRLSTIFGGYLTSSTATENHQLSAGNFRYTRTQPASAVAMNIISIKGRNCQLVG